MKTILWVLILITSPLCISSSLIEISLNEPLIDGQSPSYHGSYETESTCYDINYFTNNSLVDFNEESSRSLLNNFEVDDAIIKIFEFLEDDLTNLAKLAFTSKRLFRLLTAYFTIKFFKFNPKIFWLLPAKTRFRFALKYLYKFEKQFPGLRDRKVNLTLNDLTGLIFLTLHCQNVFFITKDDFKFIYLINSNYRISDHTTKQGLPYYAASIWRSILVSNAVKHDAFYTIESLCKIDKTVTENVIRLFSIKLGNLERKYNEKISKAIELLLQHVILRDSEKVTSLTSLLLLSSIDSGAISTFATFLPLWTANLDQLEGNSHILHKIAYDQLSCPEILSRPELTHLQLSSALLICKQVGNSDFAIEILSRFPLNVFLAHFDPDQLNIIKQIVVNPDTSQPLHVPQNLKLPVAFLLASFHFVQPNALATFSQLIREPNGRVNKQVLKALINKRTRTYYEIAARQNVSNSRNICIMS
jgi:hypothetical protein